MKNRNQIDKKYNEEAARQYQHDQIIEIVTTSVIPMIMVLVLGLFALIVLKGFISKIPTSRPVEKRIPEEIITKALEDEESPETLPSLQLNNMKSAQTQKEVTINELNEAIMSAPEDAAKLLTSYIRE